MRLGAMLPRCAWQRTSGSAIRTRSTSSRGMATAITAVTKETLLAAGGKVFDVPKIRSRTYTWVDEYTMQFSQAAVNEDEGHRGDRKWLREWLREFEAALRDGD